MGRGNVSGRGEVPSQVKLPGRPGGSQHPSDPARANPEHPKNAQEALALASTLMGREEREALVQKALLAIDKADTAGVGIIALTRTGIVRTVLSTLLPGNEL